MHLGWINAEARKSDLGKEDAENSQCNVHCSWQEVSPAPCDERRLVPCNGIVHAGHDQLCHTATYHENTSISRVANSNGQSNRDRALGMLDSLMSPKPSHSDAAAKDASDASTSWNQAFGQK